MDDARVRLGRRGEELAVAELTRCGYEIVARNWRCQVGEVDVVARRDEAWAFFEVRTRRGRELPGRTRAQRRGLAGGPGGGGDGPRRPAAAG